MCIRDSPSIEREIRSGLTEDAAEGAIHNFGLNLKPLLMQPPVKGKVTMGLDPGYRNGCKVAVIDGTGKVLDTAVVYPTFNEKKKREAIDALKKLIQMCIRDRHTPQRPVDNSEFARLSWGKELF